MMLTLLPYEMASFFLFTSISMSENVRTNDMGDYNYLGVYSKICVNSGIVIVKVWVLAVSLIV